MNDEMNQAAESLTQQLRRRMNVFAQIQEAAWNSPTAEPQMVEARKAFNELGDTLSRVIDELNYVCGNNARLRDQVKASEDAALYQALKIKRLTDTRDSLDDEVLKTFVELTKADSRVTEAENRMRMQGHIHRSVVATRDSLQQDVQGAHEALRAVTAERDELSALVRPLEALKARVAELEAREAAAAAELPGNALPAVVEGVNWVGKARVGPMLQDKSTVEILTQNDEGAYVWEYYRGPDGLVVGFDSFRAAVTYAADMNRYSEHAEADAATLADWEAKKAWPNGRPVDERFDDAGRKVIEAGGVVAMVEGFTPTADELAMDESGPAYHPLQDGLPKEKPLRVGRIIPPKPNRDQILALQKAVDELPDDKKGELKARLNSLANAQGMFDKELNSLVDEKKAE